MIYPILKMGDPRLLKVSDAIQEFDTPALHQLIADMFETMQHANGAGLAAPQIGVNLQLVIFGFKKNSRYPDAPNVPETVLINPVLTPLSDETDDAWEGCLSVPGMRGLVPRWSRVRYEGFFKVGQKKIRVVVGFDSRVVQHETDHLNGVLYPMRIKDLTQFGFTEVLFPELDPDEDD
nr:peptide deformylase [uncultured Undibacterium sp.]